MPPGLKGKKGEISCFCTSHENEDMRLGVLVQLLVTNLLPFCIFSLII